MHCFKLFVYFQAQIRACTFMALIEEEKLQTKPSFHNHKIKSQLEQPEGQLLFALVHEFLEYYNMHYTLKLYESETYQSAYSYNGRNKLLNDLHLNDDDLSSPLLSQLLGSYLKDVPNVNGMDGSSNGHLLQETKAQVPLLNQTFNVHIDSKPNTPRSVNSDGREDTYEGTSSIAEDSIKDKSSVETEKDQEFNETDHSSSGMNGFQLNNQSHSAEVEKSEKTFKSEKYRSKSPREHGSNKSRDFVLPSLYTSNQEFDDNLDNYEEDFMSTSEVELKTEVSPHSPTSLNFDKASLKSPIKESDISGTSAANETNASSINSEDFELNSTVDEILKSNSN